MKRIFSLVILLLVCGMGIAQIQQGIVKTRGRMVNGKVVPGTRLNGATITLNIGNPLVSGPKGSFSFNVPAGKNYSLVAVKKQGYTLADPEYTRLFFSYSANDPFYVVLENEAQRQADINAATRKVRRTMIAKLQAQEDEIDSLKAQNKINEQEYQTRLKNLNEKALKIEERVEKLVLRFVSVDFDQLDSINAQISFYIQNGDLSRADSLIELQGNLYESIENLKQHKEEAQKYEEYIRREQKNIAERIRQQIDIAKLKNNDKDLEKFSFELANLDTVCGEYQCELLLNLHYRFDLDFSLIYDRLINIAKNENKIQTILYWKLAKAEDYYYRGKLKECKNIYDEIILFTEEKGINVTQIKQSYRLAKVYLLCGDFNMVLKMYQKGIELKEKERGYSESVLADEYNNAAHTLCLMGRYKEAITYYEKAIAQMEPTGNRWYKSAYLFFIGYANEKMGKKNNAKKYYNESFLVRDSSKDYSKFSLIDFKKEFFLTEGYWYGYCWPNEILLEVCDNYIENRDYEMANKVCDAIEEESNLYDNHGDYKAPYAKALLQRREILKLCPRG